MAKRKAELRWYWCRNRAAIGGAYLLVWSDQPPTLTGWRWGDDNDATVCNVSDYDPDEVHRVYPPRHPLRLRPGGGPIEVVIVSVKAK